MKTYVQTNDHMPLMPVVDAVVVGPDPSLGLHEPALVLRTYKQAHAGSKLVKARRRSSDRGRSAIMANKFAKRMDGMPIERGEL